MTAVLPVEAAAGRPDDALHRLTGLVEDDLETVNALILQRMESSVQIIPMLAGHLIRSGGKRLRPMLTLASARAFGYRGEGHHRLAAAVEFIHTATLLHDDVVDESDMRRGNAAAHVVWGNQVSVLVGDFLFSRAFQLMVEAHNLRVLEILSRASAVIAEGEVMQLSSASDIGLTEDTYLKVIDAKTAELFAAAAEVGAVIAGHGGHEADALRAYGRNLGMAFQLIDDALDYAGSTGELGKEIGDDFREGKLTLPVVIAYNRGSESEQEFWRRTLEAGKQTDADLQDAIRILDKRSAIKETVERATEFGRAARTALAELPINTFTTALDEVIDFCIARVY